VYKGCEGTCWGNQERAFQNPCWSSSACSDFATPTPTDTPIMPVTCESGESCETQVACELTSGGKIDFSRRCNELIAYEARYCCVLPTSSLAPTATPDCIEDHHFCYDECGLCCSGEYYELYGDYYCGEDDVQLPTPMFTITPRPTNTSAPLPTGASPGVPTNTPVPVATSTPGDIPTAVPTPLVGEECSEPSGILARVQRDENDPLREFISIEENESIRLVCVSGQAVLPASHVELMVSGPDGYEMVHPAAIHPAWAPPSAGDYQYYCRSTDVNCDDLSSNTAVVDVYASPIASMCYRCPDEGGDGVIGVEGGDFDCDNSITMNDVSLWIREYNDSLVNGAQEERIADVDCDGEATVDDLSVWIRAYKGGD